MIVEYTAGWKLYGKDQDGNQNIITFCKDRSGYIHTWDKNANRGAICNTPQARKVWKEYTRDGYTRKKQS